MDNQSLLNDVVKIYRLCGRPDFKDNALVNCEILCDEQIIFLINNIHQKKDDIFESVKCNGSYITLPLQNSQSGQKLQFNLNIPIIGFKLFFLNLDDLITNHTGVKKGELPESFYLLENDYLTTEANEPKQLQQLKQVCRWINFLKEALPHTEEKRESYLFVLLTEDKESKGFKKHLIESRFTVNELRYLEGLETFEEMIKNTDLHSSERLAVVRNALEELLAKRPSIPNQRLGDILSEFEVFKQLYQDNYETYINGFSLKDFKKEVIESHEEFASKMEGSLNDVINKGLAIPVSIATIGALIKEQQLINSLVVSFAVLLVSIFMWCLTEQHLKRLKDIQLALDETFNKFENKKESAAKFVNNKRLNLIKRSESIVRVLKTLRWLGFTPFISAIVLLCYKFPEIPAFFHTLICSITS